MPSIFSIGLTLSRTMPSMRSEQPAAEERGARCVGQHVLRFVEQPLRFGFDRGAHLLGGGRDPHFVCFLLGDQHLDLDAGGVRLRLRAQS